MKPDELTSTQLFEILAPETPLEKSFFEDESFIKGLRWGVPRYGHPEGTIWAHILEINDNIDNLPIDLHTRELLRIINYVHDTFKYKEDRGIPRDWTQHHPVLAREFLAKYIDDEQLLNVVELHDEAYYCWRLACLYDRVDHSEERLKMLRERVGDYWQLYYLFFKCDTSTGDKNQEPLIWFENKMTGIEPVEFIDRNS